MNSFLKILILIVGVAIRSFAAELTSTAASPPGFFENVRKQAREAAAKPYEPPKGPELPGFLRDLSYNGYVGIQFRPEKALWAGEPGRFQIQFFPPGYLYREPVRINVIEHGEATEVRFSPEAFDYGSLRFPDPVPRDLFFSGLRVHYLPDQTRRNYQVAVFLGSCYFRVAGLGQVFGASARGLALDTAASTGEEFPRFVEFWIEKPGALADQLRLFARLESRRVSGAYQFLIKPGQPTVVEIQSSLFFRETVKKAGLAPLTSMFFFGENRTRWNPDFRPEVHDSDGLLMAGANRSWLWRPLENPGRVHRVSEYPHAGGFGLLQRDRNFDHYQDLETHYQNRPSLWVTPSEDWGPGRVELVEIPSEQEGNDNIIAYWVPEHPPEPGRELRFSYVLRGGGNDPDRPSLPVARVMDTRLQMGEKERTRFVIDFTGGTLSPEPADAPVTADLKTSKGRIENLVTQLNLEAGGWRVFFDLQPDGKEPVDLRLELRRHNQTISETWMYRFTSPQP